MRYFYQILVLTGLITIACVEDQPKPDPLADLNDEAKEPDLDIDVSASALYSEDQLKQIEDFEEAKKRFSTMSLDTFKTEYGPNASYRETLNYNPNDASNISLIRESVELSGEQYSAYEELGFVVLKDVKYENFFQGFIKVYSDDLPLYFSADAMLDALHLSFDRILMDLEIFVLSQALDNMLTKMEAKLEELDSSDGPADLTQSYDDAAVWLCVTKSLLAGKKASCLRQVDSHVNSYLDYINNEKPARVAIFGKTVDEDFSQFKPRGHYTKKESLKKYFRAMMWVQRIGMDFVKYSRHTRLAFMLTDLLHSSGATEEYETINETIEVLVGHSDSMTPFEFKEIADKLNIATIADLEQASAIEAFAETAVKEGAGKQLINSTIMAADQSLGPDEFTPIPPIYNFMGQRFIVDSYVFTNVVYDRVKEPQRRYMPSPLDTWFVLGNRETVSLLEDELNTYQYHSNLLTLDYLITTYSEEFWGDNFYNAWLSALMTLDNDTQDDAYPEVMQTRAWQLRMLNAQLGSWAHLRHDTLLYAKPSYSMTDCEYPDAWVDPNPEFFLKIADIADFTQKSFEQLGIFDLKTTAQKEESDNSTPDHEVERFYGSDLKSYYSRLNEIALMLADIAETELASQPLSDPQLDFMNRLIFAAGGSGAPPFDGWYAELIYKQTVENDSLFDPTIADIHTHPRDGEVLHVGTGHPNLMLISIETNCQIRSYLGPVLSYHELIEGGFNRLDDETWKERLEAGQESRPAWTKSFIQ